MTFFLFYDIINVDEKGDNVRKATHFSYEILKKIKGTTCCNCGINCEENIVYHHVVPISNGGNDIISNIIPVCTECHSIIHFGESHGLKNYSELIKKGLKRARAEGKTLGRRKTTYKDLPPDFEKYVKLVENGMPIVEAAKQLQISRTSFYKYREIYNNYQEKLSSE